MTSSLPAPRVVAAWILGRFLTAVIAFRILGIPAFWDPSLSLAVRLISLVLLPGSVELLALGMWIIRLTDDGF